MSGIITSHYPLSLEAIPSSWESTTVGDAMRDIQPGFASGVHNQEGLGIPHLRPMNVDREGKLDLSVVKYVSPDKALRIRAGDVLFNNTNSAELIGKTTHIGIDAELAFSNHMTRLRPGKSIDHRFVAYQLHFLWMTGYFMHRCTHHVNQASISSQTLGETVPLVVPPSLEQVRIVEEIDKQFTLLDAAVSALKRIQANLKRYRASVLKTACEGRLVPSEVELARRERRSYESASALFDRILATPQARWEAKQLHKLKAGGKCDPGESWKSRYIPAPSLSDKPLPQLPEGWLWATTGQVGDVQLGRQRSPKHHSGTHMRPYLRVANVFEDRIDTSDILTMNFTPSEFKTFELKPGDILLNEGQSLELVGRAAIYQGEVPGACFQNTLIRFRPFVGVDASFALLVFRSYLHNQRFQKIARWTTNIAHLGAERLSAVEFPIPPLNEQLRIVAEADRQLSIINEIDGLVEANLRRANNLRQSILKKAFEGKLVPQDPKDEPASTLLERIRAEREAKSGSAKSEKQAREASVR